MKNRIQFDGLKEQPVDRDDREVRKVLVVQELRESEFELRNPEVQRVGRCAQGIARRMHHQQVQRAVIWAGRDASQFRCEPDGVEQHRRHHENAPPPGRPRIGVVLGRIHLARRRPNGSTWFGLAHVTIDEGKPTASLDGSGLSTSTIASVATLRQRERSPR